MAELEEALLNTGDEYLKRLGRETAKAIRRTEAEIALWYKRFAKNNNISLAEAKRWLTASELKELKWTVEEYIEYAEKNELDPRWTKELENASAKVHINRLDALKLELKQSAQIIGQAQKTGIKKVLETVYKDGYYRTAFEFQSALGIGWSLSGVDEARIRKVLSSPWTADGNTFSDRIWKNQQALISELETALTQMIMRGEGPLETAKAVADRFGVAQNRAATLVYTESAAFAESARNDCYKELGVELCRIDGTLDTATCERCGAVDGTVLKLSDCKVGVTAPPFHPRCRCTTVPHYDDWEEFGITPERIARDAETGEHFEVPANMTYEQWKALQDERHGAGTVDKKRKMHYNEKADGEQYIEYVGRLGDEAPKTFNQFQNIKYGDHEAFQELCELYRYKGKVLEATLSDFKAYKAIMSLGVRGTVRVPPNPIDISELAFNDEHATRHGCTLNDAVGYIKNAKCSITRNRWDGSHTNYYSFDGASYVADDSNKIKTAFSNADFDPITWRIMEVFK